MAASSVYYCLLSWLDVSFSVSEFFFLLFCPMIELQLLLDHTVLERLICMLINNNYGVSLLNSNQEDLITLNVEV